jgi:hypothetical protein
MINETMKNKPKKVPKLKCNLPSYSRWYTYACWDDCLHHERSRLFNHKHDRKLRDDENHTNQRQNPPDP